VSAEAEKVALDAHTDQVLAGLADARRDGGEFTTRVLPLSRSLAGVLRVQFPGQDRELARVLVAVASELAGLDCQLTEAGMAPGEVAPALVNVVCFAADDLNRAGPDGARA
jgi:hypothetical protein